MPFQAPRTAATELGVKGSRNVQCGREFHSAVGKVRVHPGVRRLHPVPSHLKSNVA
jgi:hypothetical protein